MLPDQPTNKQQRSRTRPPFATHFISVLFFKSNYFT